MAALKSIYRRSRKLQQFEMRLAILAVGIALSACQTISTYDEKAYEKQTSCLADMLKLLDVANTPYEQNLDQIKAVSLNIERAYQYDYGRPLNKITIAQWDLIRDPRQGSFAGFLAFWKKHGTVSDVYIREKKQQIGDQMDRITGLETGKIH